MGTGASRADGHLDKTRPGQLTRAEPGSVVYVQLTKDGFLPADLIITSGQVLSISWACGTEQNVKQVILDNQLVLEVIGGYDSGDPTYQGQYDIEFNLEGEFKFFSAGLGTGKLLNVTVYSQAVIRAEVTDEGFQENAWQIFQGNTIKWMWSGCDNPHTVNEVQLCAKHTGVLTTKASDAEPMRTGSYKRTFDSPGMFYFQTEGRTGGQLQLCIIQVKEIQREHKIDVTDLRYNPKMLTIQEGDKVWWEWNRLKCKKQHKIVQIQSPSMTGSESLRSVRGGFFSEGPSRSGMLCHVFKTTGVYYYGDETDDGLKMNFGIIIVKPKQIVHPIEVSADGFYPDLQTICAGDCIQWEWDVDTVIKTFSIMLIESCVAGEGKSGSEVDCNNKCQYLDNFGESLVTCFGVTSVQLNTTGVFQYRISDSTIDVGCCSIIVQPGSQDHFINVMENGFQPKSLIAHPGDRIWWMWEGSNVEHNIIQVNKDGHSIADGFCSGQAHSIVGAYLHEVVDTGIFYYKSSGLPNIHGSFLVKTQAKIHEVSVANNVILPDPVLVEVNDCVAWLWPQMSKHGVTKVNHTREIQELKMYTQDILLPRRCIAKHFTKSGINHYYSKAFSTKGDKFMDEDISCTMLSSVVVSNNPEHTLVNVTKKGFKPAGVTIQKGHSVMWSWKDTNEHHNIVHVNPPDHPHQYQPVVGSESFRSDNNNERFYTHKFQNYGRYHVTSEGVPGCVFVANVIDDDIYTSAPTIASECNGGIVKQWHKVLLKTTTDDGTILYTLDGSVPELHSPTTRVYKDDQGICLKRPGLVVVRAIAVCSDSLNSSIFTSNRFWILQMDKNESFEEEDAFSLATEDFEEDEMGPTSRWQWWNCVPEIKGWIVEPGMIQLIWESPASEDAVQLKCYQVFIDGVCYRNFIPVTCTSVVVLGLPGGNAHAVSVVAVPSEQAFLPLESNRLYVKNQLQSSFGGPLTSCAIAEDTSSFYLIWPTLDNRGRGASYSIYANGKQCGHKVQPQNESQQCKVLIEDCELKTKYNFHVQVKFEGSTEVFKSNNIQITLPLNVSAITPGAGHTLVELPFIQVIESKQKTHCLSKELLKTVDSSMAMEHSGLVDDFGKTLPEQGHSRNLTFDVNREEVVPSINKQYGHRETISMFDNTTVDEDELTDETQHTQCESDNDKLSTTDSDQSGEMQYLDVNKVAENLVQNSINIDDQLTLHSKDINEGQNDDEIHGDVAPSNPLHVPSSHPLHDPALHDKTSCQSLMNDDIAESNKVTHIANDSITNDKNSFTKARDVLNGREMKNRENEEDMKMVINDNEEILKAVIKDTDTMVMDEERLGCTVENKREDDDCDNNHIADGYSEDSDTSSESSLSDNEAVVAKDSKEERPIDCTVGKKRDGVSHRNDIHSEDSDESSESSDDRAVSSRESTEGRPLACTVEKKKNCEDVINHTEDVYTDDSDSSSESSSSYNKDIVIRRGEEGCTMVDKPRDINKDVINTEDNTGTKDLDSSSESSSSEDDDGTNDRRSDSTVVNDGNQVEQEKSSADARGIIVMEGSECDKANVVLPTPAVVVRTNAKDSTVSLQWQCARVKSTTYAFSHYMVHVEGTSFSEDIQSHGRCEVTDDAGLESIRHSWNADLANSITIKQLMENCKYRVFVTASFSHSDPKRGTLQTVSDYHQCLTGGRPQAPVLMVKSLGVQEVVLWWKPGICHRSIEVVAYQFYKNEKRKGSLMTSGTVEKCIANIKPGTTHIYQVQAITDDGRNSYLSNHISITCPAKPDPPNLMVEPSSEAYTAQVSWSRPKGSKGRVISSYCIYVNGKLHGDVTVDEEHQKSTKMRYKLQDMKPGEDYEVFAKTYAGWRTMEPSSDILCGVMSDESSSITVCCPAVPASPTPRLAGMHNRGIDITWDAVQPYGDAAISGYLLLKDGKPVIPIMDSHTQHHTISGLALGTSVILQIVALTDHPVGRLKQHDINAMHSDEFDKFITDSEVDKYSACRPGPKLKVEYTGLVQSPINVQCCNITSQTACITWQQSYDSSGHYIPADQHQVTWWATKNKDRGVQSQTTQDNRLKLYLLEPDTQYTIVVEARKQDFYTANNKGDRNSYTFIVSGQSDPLYIITSKPPEAPNNMRLVSSTCSSVELSWTQPVHNGSQIIGLRMYVVTEDEDYCITESHLDLPPEAKSAVIPGLMENTSYTFILVVVTKEHFDAVQEKSDERSLPEEWVEVPEDSPWLPFVSIDAKTSGTEPPNNLRCVKYSQSSVTLLWDAPQYGSDRLLKYVVRWMVVSNKKKQASTCTSEGTLEIFTEEKSAEVKLFPGKTYSMTVEAHLSDFYQASNDDDITGGYITCLSSDMIQVRIPAPVEAPTLLIKEFTTSSLELHWQKPVLFTALKSSEKSCCHLCIHRTLLGYRLIVNDEIYSNLEPTALSCTLKNLSPGTLNCIQLAVITNTTGGSSSKQSIDSDDQDEALSPPLEVTLPKYESGSLVTMMASFHSVKDAEKKNKRPEFGELVVNWSIADCGTVEEQGIVGYNLNWMSTADGKEHTATVAPDMMSYKIPVHYQRCIYDVTVNIMKEDDMWQDLNTPSIQWIIPGSPDPPIVGCSSITPDEFILEWGAPRVFGGVGIRGYKVYMNDKPIGNELSASHHKAVIPCRPNRTYHVNLVALCASPVEFQDSLLSEELHLRSPGNISEFTCIDNNHLAVNSPTHSKSTSLPEDVFLNVSKVTDSTISIRWSRPSFEGDENVKRVKIQWSSVMKPKEIEALLKPIASQYTIRNCSAGAAHFVTVFLLDGSDQVINRSKQISIHTAAPIQTPKLSIENYDFHQCTLKWNKPKVFGDTMLTGYRLKVNGKDLKNLLPQEMTYIFTQGKMCRQYSFSIQALCNVRYLNSELSEPVVLEWPGVTPPTVKRIPTTKAASIKIEWTEPKLTGGAKIAHYRAVLVDESACQNKVQRRAATIVSPVLGPETSTAEFHDLLLNATYKVSLEVHLEGLERAIRTRSIVTRVAKKPTKPIVQYVVRGVEERRTLESDACNLINERDKLLHQLVLLYNNQGLRHAPASTQTELQLSDVLASLSEVEGYLKQCLEALHAFTGAVEVTLKWEQVKDDGDAVVTGYKVYLNGKQYGFQVHAQVNEMVLKLSAYHPINKITVIATTEHAVGDSEPSDVIVVNTAPFRPFASYCFHSTHTKEARFPRVGSCAYIDSLMREIGPTNFNNITALHHGFKRRKIPPASVSVIDVFDGAWHLLIPSKITNRNPTIILFWTKWCLAASKILTFFVAYAKKKTSMVSCIACCCASRESTGTHRQSLAQTIVGNGWRDDKVIRHCCCCHTSHAGLNPRRQTSSVSRILLASSGRGRRHSTVSLDMSHGSHSKISIPELFGVIGVPTLVVLHPDGYIVWQGRFAANDSTAFETFLDVTLEKVTGSHEPELSQTAGDQRLALSSLSSSTLQTISASPIASPPPSPGRSSASIIRERNLRWLDRPKTARQRKSSDGKLNRKISINKRPYSSASAKPPKLQPRPKSSVTI